ncbi:MAG: sn-glycerol-3-phosphate ABC transporter ATP-binding protein UgpC [Desulfobacterales bacterium]|nr:MAG: sn-glycerol-3-phosphate ABC transporter ATP-binding protein UgpC [Desulfobacterales bacterium]
MATVVYEDICKNFGKVKALQDINVEVKDGKFAALLGPSGCGKSTLLRLTAGLETISSGNLYIDAQRVNQVHPRDRDIAMVFQNYALYPQMNIYNNIAFSLQVKKVAKSEIDKQVHWAANILNIEALLDRYPHQLSGGQAQRVAMGRAIVRNPKVFLFDEPLSNLDAKLREQMRFEVRTLHNRLEATTIYVTHDQVEAMTMADEILVMRDGLIQQVGSPSEVFDKPANLFVADFIGTPSINLLRGEIAAEEGHLVFRGANFVLPLPSETSLARGRKIVYGLRPQHIKVLTEPSEAHPHIIEAQLILSETTGTETQFSFDYRGQKLIVANQGRFAIAADTACRLKVDVEKAHFFDQETGKRIAAGG